MKLIIILACLGLSGCMPRVITVRVIDSDKERVVDLEMQNAALKAANSYLLDLTNKRP